MNRKKTKPILRESGRQTADRTNTDPLPAHSAKDIAALRASLEIDGVLELIVIDEKQHVIDGRLRKRLCIELGIEWKSHTRIVPRLTDHQKLALRVVINDARRSTSATPEQRAEYVDILILADPTKSDGEIAKIARSSQSTVWRRRQELIQANKLKPVLATIGKDGKARAVSSEKRRRANRHTNIMPRHANDVDTLTDKLASIKSELPKRQLLSRKVKEIANREDLAERQKKALSEYHSMPPTVDLQHCDLRDLKIKRHSVDLICTDPLWFKSKVDTWKALAEKSVEWLKPNGVLCIFFGVQTYPLLLRTLYPIFGDPQVTNIVLQPNNQALDREHFALPRHRMVFLFGKKRIDLGTIGNETAMSSVFTSAEKDKSLHEFQQALDTFEWLITHLSNPGQMVVDPCMGSGTTGVAVTKLSRRFTGCDIEKKWVGIARSRIYNEALKGRKVG